MFKWEPGYTRTSRTDTGNLLEYYTHIYFRDNGKPFNVSGDYTAAETFWKALEDNILYRDWTPAHPIFLYHTEEDEVVVVDNYRNCLNKWKGSDMVKGTIYKGRTETHVSYGSYFFMFHCGEGIKAIFNNESHKYPFERIDRGEL